MRKRGSVYETLLHQYADQSGLIVRIEPGVCEKVCAAEQDCFRGGRASALTQA